MQELSFSTELHTTFLEAIDDVIFALWKEWFWVMTRIDFKEKMKEKLWVEVWEYMVLWACKPEIAYSAFSQDSAIWLFLPCNVIVYEKQGKVMVESVRPTMLLASLSNQEVKKIALEAEESLRRVIESL